MRKIFCAAVSLAAIVSFVPRQSSGQATAPAAQAAATTRATSDVTLEQQMEQLIALQQQVQAKLLAVPEEDLRAHADFLKQPDTGIIKLLPREKYDRVLHLRGGGAYYSFVLRTHEYGRGSDIALEQKRLSCGFAGGDYGYFLPLGDVPIEKAATATAQFPHWAPAEARGKWDEFWSDLPTDSDVIRRREFEAVVAGGPGMIDRGVGDGAGQAYLLRSVSPGRSDVLVAFRVERQFDDGSVLLSWKLLKQFAVEDARAAMRRRMEQRRDLEQQRRQQMDRLLEQHRHDAEPMAAEQAP